MEHRAMTTLEVILDSLRDARSALDAYKRQNPRWGASIRREGGIDVPPGTPAEEALLRLNGILYDDGLEYAMHIMRRRARLKIVPPGGAA
jgi:hypothetical protein